MPLHDHLRLRALLLLLVPACLLLSACGGGDGGTSPTPDPGVSGEELHAGSMLIDGALQAFLDAAGNGAGDPRVDAFAALEAAAAWLESQEGVAATDLADSTYLHVEFVSGLRQLVRLDFRGPDGRSLHRGGGADQALKVVTDCDRELENTKVLFFTAVTEEFGIDLADQQQLRDRLESSPIGLEVTLLRDEACTPDAMRTFSQYGLVLLDTHGARDATLTGKRVTVTGAGETVGLTDFLDQVRTRLGDTDYARLLRGELTFGRSLPVAVDSQDWFEGLGVLFDAGEYEVWATSAFVRTLGPLGGTIVWNGSCYSGFTAVTEKVSDPIGAAYLSRGPLAYYGWTRADGTSKTVDSGLCVTAQQSFLDRLLDEQCTGAVHRKADDRLYVSIPRPAAYATFLAQYGDSAAHYQDPCQAEPLVDPRDGQTYETTCVGDRIWMAENLRFGGLCYGGPGVPGDCASQGRLYYVSEVTGLQAETYDQPVQGICPPGWHVPSRDEFRALIREAGGEAVAGRKIAARNAWPSQFAADDSLGFSLVPTGMGLTDDIADNEWDELGQFWYGPDDLDEHGRSVLWTSTRDFGALSEEDFEAFFLFAGWGVESFEVRISGSYPSEQGSRWQFPCRCIKDVEEENKIRWH